MTRGLDSPVTAAVVLAVVALLLGLPGLGSLDLIRMEGMVAAVALEMLESGDFVVPRLYGEIYAYKPPFVYWLAAAAFELAGGASEWALRLPSALSGLVMGMATLLVVGRLVGYRLGLVAGLASFTSGLFLQKLRLAEFDAILAALVGVAVACACYALAREPERGRLSIWLVCYLALAAALLSKGMPALMAFAPGLLLAAAWTGRWRLLFHWQHLLGVALFLVAVSAWVGSAYAAAGPAAFEQPIQEARLRGSEWTLEALGRTLLKPISIGAYFLPWSCALFWGWPVRGSDNSEERLLRAAWGFLIGGTLVFMAVPTDESRYYLPLAAPLGIACALALPRMADSPIRASRILPGALAGVLGLMTLAAGVSPTEPPSDGGGRTLLVLLAVAAVTAATSVLRHPPRLGRTAAALFATALCFWGIETQLLAPRKAAGRGQQELAGRLAPRVPPGETVWMVGTPGSIGAESSSLIYYGNLNVRVMDLERGPPPGGLSLFRAVDLERLSPSQREALNLIEIFTGPRWTYHLCRSQS